MKAILRELSDLALYLLLIMGRTLLLLVAFWLGAWILDLLFRSLP